MDYWEESQINKQQEKQYAIESKSSTLTQTRQVGIHRTLKKNE